MENNQHLEYELHLKVNVCTELDKQTLIDRFNYYIEAMPDCFVCINDWRVNNVKLCDCSALKDKLEEQNADE